MKIITILTLLNLYSCAHKSFEGHLVKGDPLENETFERYKIETFSPKKTDFFGEMASLCLKGNYNKASAEFSKNVEKYSTNAKYWNVVGVCNFYQKKYSSSLFYYRLGLNYAKKHEKGLILNNLGVLSLALKKERVAENYFLESVKLNRQSRLPKINLVKLYLDFNVTDKAYDILSKDLLSLQKDKEYMYLMAKTLYLKRRYEESWRIIKMAGTALSGRKEFVDLKERLIEKRSEKVLKANQEKFASK